MKKAPRATRPHIPGYGISQGRKGMLPWKWAEQRLAKARTYWVSTVRPDQRPHTMPIWGHWMDGKFWFSSGRETRKVRNLATNPNVVITAEVGKDDVVIEGVAQEITAMPQLKQFCAAYNKKYKWDTDPTQGPFFAVQPRVAFGLTTRPGQFVKTATRWMFDGKQ
jgi:Pyridoxamine 5'-phosphate oxidase